MKKTKAKSKVTKKRSAPGADPQLDDLRRDDRPARRRAAIDPEQQTALALKMARPFKLIGYYRHPGAGPAIAMVMVEQDANDPAEFITVEVKDHEKGTCILPHNFGADQFELARANFLSRTNLEVIFARRR